MISLWYRKVLQLLWDEEDTEADRDHIRDRTDRETFLILMLVLDGNLKYSKEYFNQV